MTVPPAGGTSGLPTPRVPGFFEAGRMLRISMAAPPTADTAEAAARHRALLVDLVRDALEMGQAGHALDLLDRLWGDDLSREDCWFLRGQALYTLQRFLDAGRGTQAGLDRVPRSVALLYLLCNCEARLNHFGSAETAIVRALALLPDHPLLLCRYAHLLAQAGRLDQAQALLGQAESLAPGYALVEQEQRFIATLSGRGGVSTEDQIGALIRESADPYARPSLGAALLGAGVSKAAAPGGTKPRVPTRWRRRWTTIAVVVAAAVVAYASR